MTPRELAWSTVDDVRTFYDDLAPLYHLVYENWEASVVRQGAALASIIAERWGADARVVLDGAVGIGTQALGLLMRGFDVIGSDLSLGAIRRATREAAARGLRLRCLVADFRALATRSAAADIVLIADNALPHLQSEADILTTLRECFRCARPGGGCLISMRDYGTPPPAGTVEVKPYDERLWSGRRYDLRQVWTWRGPRYDLSLEVTPMDGESTEQATILTTRYLAIAPARVAALMSEAGFESVERIDGRFFQPVLVGTRRRV
jgi:SAM-dependent methyltransferase